MADLKLAWDVSGSGDLRAAAAAAARHRFHGLTTSAAQLAVRELSATGRREVRAILARHNLAGAALRCDAPARGLTADADADHLLSELESAMSAARDCGFAMVACDLGRLPRTEQAAPPPKPVAPEMLGSIILPDPAEIASLTAPPPAPLTPDERRHGEFAVEVLRAAGERADRIGIPVAFSASLATTPDLAAILLAAACPLFGRELDPVAALEEGPAGVVAQEPSVLHVRGRDAWRGAGGKTRPAPLGEGDVDWPELTRALADAAFAGFVSLELAPSAVAPALERLRTM